MKVRLTYPYLVGRRSRVRFSGCLRPCGGRSPARRAGAQSHVVGVLAPLPRVNHEVAEAGTGRRHVFGLPWFDGGGLDDGHQDSLGRVVAEDNTRVLIVSHCAVLGGSQPPESSPRAKCYCKSRGWRVQAGERYKRCAYQSGVNMSFISKREQRKSSPSSPNGRRRRARLGFLVTAGALLYWKSVRAQRNLVPRCKSRPSSPVANQRTGSGTTFQPNPIGAVQWFRVVHARPINTRETFSLVG